VGMKAGNVAVRCAMLTAPYRKGLQSQPQSINNLIYIENGEPCWVRTSDLLIKSQLLYRLS
jgi:hypothetical protein